MHSDCINRGKKLALILYLNPSVSYAAPDVLFEKLNCDKIKGV